MKTLIVMRHGKAMPPAQDQRDIDRSLTETGIEALEARLPHMLRLLEAKGITAQIWSSPAKRARQTAKILKRALEQRGISVQKGIELHDCLWEQNIEEFLSDLRTNEAELIFAVGHVPFVEDVVEALTGSTPFFSTGALGCLQMRHADANEHYIAPVRDHARLLWFCQGPVSANWKTLPQLQDTLTKVVEAVEHHRDAFIENPKDIETIHRFRTNTRTLRSLLAFVEPWQTARQNDEVQATLKEIVGYTSRLRELDVLEKQANANPDASPELLALCKKAARTERAVVLKTLSSKKTSKALKGALAQAKNVTWKKRYLKQGLPKSEVRARFDAMIESVEEELAILQLSDAERTHDVRKHAKRVRYVAQHNGDILGEDAVVIASNMTLHQDNLGDICDARVNIRLINEFLQQDLPEHVVWELSLMRAQNETFLYSALKTGEA